MTLLAEAPAGRHIAQFHRNSESLTESVYTFVEGGLRRGDSVVVIASPELTDALATRLSYNKLYPDALSQAGKICLLDVDQHMAQSMPDGVLESRCFRDAIVPVLSRLQPVARGIRILDEMGSRLWNAGRADGAIRLEELWNALAKLYTFSLYCGYTLDMQSEESYVGPLEEVGRAHSDILGTEDDERFGAALDRASKEIFGISLSQMTGITSHDGARRFPSAQRTMLWVKRNLPLTTSKLVERARRHFEDFSGGRQ